MKKLTSCFDNLSIANRLAVMYALVATVVLSVIVVVLYILETTEINRYQTAEMKSRFKIIEEHVTETTTTKDWKHLVKNLQEIMIPDGGLYILIQSDDPAFSFAAPYRVARSQISKNNGFGKISVKGNMHRTLSKILPPAGERPEVILSIAIDTYFYEEENLWLDVAFGSLLIIGITTIVWLGWLIARFSLAPVDTLSRHAESLSPQNLSARLPNTRLPTELSGLVLSFNGALERLEQSYLRLSTFNADVAHELRTPLGNLIGATEVALSRPRSNEELQDVMASNLEELERLRTIINDMLFLARAEQGELAINQVPTSLASEINKTAEFLDVIFEEHRNRLEVDGDALVLAEQSLLKRALTNLLNNAVTHGRPDSTVKVEITSDEKRVTLTVINRGPDIPAEDLPNLFNRFYRTSKERKNSDNNHGLGLAIVKAIIEMHNGEVFACSDNGIIKIGFHLPAYSVDNPQTID